jgi:hypothetical protein
MRKRSCPQRRKFWFINNDCKDNYESPGSSSGAYIDIQEGIKLLLTNYCDALIFSALHVAKQYLHVRGVYMMKSKGIFFMTG